jgi:hypothetical protein
MQWWTSLKALWLHEYLDHKVFGYHAQRALVGVIALMIPIILTIVSSEELASLSVSYHTDARDMFVGLLFIVGSFLFAYKGHYFYQNVASKIAALAAFAVALYPTICVSLGTSTMCDGVVMDPNKVHGAAAGILFSILAFFCLVPFKNRAESKPGKNAKIRKWVYVICGYTILLSILYIVLLIANVLTHATGVYWGETIALSAFGIAWIVSGQYFDFYSEP